MMTKASKNSGEFDLIERLFAPYADPDTALNLRDDAACYTPQAGYDLVISTDMLVSGVHFPLTASPEMVAGRLVGSNISDLAAKGAVPVGCLLNLALGADWDEAFLTAFAADFGARLQDYNMPLWGGDTVQSQRGQNAMVSLSVYGVVPQGTMVRRDGAQIGDDVYVTGNIGDGFLGLQHALNQSQGESLATFAQPDPPLAFGQGLRGLATSCLDVSDGLAADLDHLCAAAHVAMRLEASAVPLSKEGQAYIAQRPAQLMDLLAGGDDYQLAFTAPASAAASLSRLAGETAVRLTRLGCVESAAADQYRAVFIDQMGENLVLERRGFQHF
jgi:thiamine-monophosphate kinase